MLDSAASHQEQLSRIENAPTNYNQIIINKLGLSEINIDTVPSELFFLIRHAHGNKVEVANGESYTAENTTGFFAQLGAWYERQADKEMAQKRLQKAQVVFYDGKKIGRINEKYGRVVGDTVIAAHHQSFNAHNINTDKTDNYETMNCSLGGDEGFALVVPRDPNTDIDLKELQEKNSEQTKAIEEKWLRRTKYPLSSLPSTAWQKNWHIAPLSAIKIDHNLEKMRRASDASAVIENLVDAIKKYQPGKNPPDPEATNHLLGNLIQRAQSTIFSGEIAYRPRHPLLPNRIVKMRNKLITMLEGKGATEKQKNIIDILAEHAPYSELFAQQEILDRTEFIEVVRNVLKPQENGTENNSIEHHLKSAETKDAQDDGEPPHPRRWQLAIVSSRLTKQANTAGRLEGTEELWMVADSIQNSLRQLKLTEANQVRACVGKSGGSFPVLIFASDREAFTLMKTIYSEEIDLRRTKNSHEISSALDLHITTSVNTLDPGIEVETQLDDSLANHYGLETWQTLAQTGIFSQVPKYIGERWQRRAPQALIIFLNLLFDITDRKLVSQATEALQAARAAIRAAELSQHLPEPVIGLRDLTARSLRERRRSPQVE